MPIGRGAPHDPAESRLAAARVQFLTGDTPRPDAVRDTIRASWARSRQFEVAAAAVEVPFVRQPDLDAPLVRGAMPVLSRLSGLLAGQPLSIVLTDANGLVLSRHTDDALLAQHLDRVMLAPGFSYSERTTGTNGIGTALESGGPMVVFGHEHYAEDLQDLACAAVPIRHPITGKVAGAVDLTCWRRDAGTLLLTLARTTAEQITGALLADASRRELGLLHAYLRACSRSTGMVFAVSDELTMLNDLAQTTLSPQDQADLRRQCAEMPTHGNRSVTVELPSGTTVRVSSRPVDTDGLAAGVVLEAHVVASAAPPAARVSPGPAAMALPGLVGTSLRWRRACAALVEATAGQARVALQGEPGVGKLVMLRAAHQRSDPGSRFSTLGGPVEGGADWLPELRRLLTEDGLVVLRRPDLLDAATLRLLVDEVAAADRHAPARLALTLGASGPSELLAPLLRLFPVTVTVPPLRHHIEDVAVLAPFLISRLGFTGRVTLAPEAIQLLMRHDWPGNVEELLQVLRRVVERRRSGVVPAADLPPELHAGSRRRLSLLESMERDAIVAALLDSEGRKQEAAESLGMSRATIYRKIHDYGIVSPHQISHGETRRAVQRR